MPPPPLQPQKIIVVGGSLAGLFTATTLLRLGHKVTILERSPTPLLHDQGAGIVAGVETRELFRRFDTSGRDIGVRSRQRVYLGKGGEVVSREDSSQVMTSWDLLYHIGRWAVDGIRSGYIPNSAGNGGKGEYEYGRSVEALEDMGEQVVVRYRKVREGEDGLEESTMADMVVVADGAGSRLREALVSGVKERRYAGYVAFRGTVPESELSATAADVFIERFAFFHGQGTQILAYVIPGPEGTLEVGKRLVNWVWYWNLPADSDELTDTFTDVHGNRHRWTLPTGGAMQPHIWQKQKDIATKTLPPQFSELVHKTARPFVQAITDLEPPPKGTQVGRLLGGKVVLVGDALAGFRPHTAASTGQAALHALLFERVFKGEMDWEEYEAIVLEHAEAWQKRGVMLGDRSQFGRHPLAF
jgi:2-polyprenyl-6-methoxyphenol hydroxylase-like FAD-dependent oxidoreductase